MATISIILVLLIALVLSSFISRALPLPLAVPPPLVQIAIGAAISLAPQFSTRLDPEIFFLLIVPPLLFFDGWRIPNEDLIKEKSVNLQLALGLVALTVIGIGGLAHWLIPGMPLAVCFAFAAAISPTDAIAVTSIAGRAALPRRLMRILAGESLLNDATGLVCLRLSIAAVLVGTFSIVNAAMSFLWVAATGIAIGLCIALAIAHGSNWLAKRLGEEAGLQVIISLLIPFAAYLLAEQLHGSGVLAAVSAGIAMSYTDSSGTDLTTTRMQRASVWETIHFAASGVVFVLLGEQLPALLNATDAALRTTGERGLWRLLFYIVVINMGLLTIRAIWIAASHCISPRHSYVSDGASDGRRLDKRLLAIMVLASPRGAITLAGAMTLPLSLNNGTAFPARDLVIVLSIGVIVLSLLIASVALPLLLKEITVDDDVDPQQENMARVWSARAALNTIKGLQRKRQAEVGYSADHEQAISRMTKLYESVIEARSRDGLAAERTRESELVDRELRVKAIQAERDAIFDLLKEQKISSDMANKIIRELDLLETHHDAPGKKPTQAP